MLKKIGFLSDTHLFYKNTAQLIEFSKMFNHIGRQLSQLYLVGDIFEYWIGEDKAWLERYKHILQTMRSLTKSGLKIVIIPGNRDYLLNKNFTNLTGAFVSAEQMHLRLDRRRVFITHGDLMLNRSLVYYFYRKLATLYPVRSTFLHLPFAVREAIAGFLRKISEQNPVYQHFTPEQIIKFTENIFHGVDTIICAHTHYRQHFTFEVRGIKREVFILGCFEKDGSYLVYDGDFSFVSI